MPRGPRQDNRILCYCNETDRHPHRVSPSRYQAHLEEVRAIRLQRQLGFLPAEEDESDSDRADLDDGADFDNEGYQQDDDQVLDSGNEWLNEDDSYSDDDEDQRHELDTRAMMPIAPFASDFLESVSTIQDMFASGSRQADRNLLTCYYWKFHGQLPSVAFDANKLPAVLRNSMSDRGAMLQFGRVQKLLSTFVPEINMRELPCCWKSCMAALAGELRCAVCNEPIYDRDSKPRRVFWYLPLADRLRLEWAIPEVARQRRAYMDSMATHSLQHGGPLTDIWDASLAAAFREDCMPFALSTDGVEMTNGTASAWPVVLVNLADPPTTRYRNVRTSMIIPGNPGQLSTFLTPLIEEFIAMHDNGLRVFDGARREYIVVYPRLSLVTADTPAMAKATGLRGANALCHCRFCRVKSVPCPAARNHPFYPSFPDGYSADLLAESRHDLQREVLAALATPGDAQTRESRMQAVGVSSLSILHRVPTLDWTASRSFPLDPMHLYGNVMKLVWRVLIAEIVPDDRGYSLSRAQQAAFGRAMRESNRTVPDSVCRTTRDISSWRSFKAVELMSLILQFSLPLLFSVGAPAYVIENFRFFVHGVRLSMQTSLQPSELASIAHCFQSFVAGFEMLYYHDDEWRLQVCTSQLHGLLHIADCLRALGPAFVFWQYSAERTVGSVQASTRSSRYPIKSAVLSTVERERLNFANLMYNIRPIPDIAAQHISHGHMPVRAMGHGEVIGWLSMRRRGGFVPSERVDVAAAWLSTTSGTNCDSANLQEHRRLEIDVKEGTARTFTVKVDNARNLTHGATRSRACVKFTTPDHAAGTDYSYGRVVGLFYDNHLCRVAVVVNPFALWLGEGSGQLRYPHSPIDTCPGMVAERRACAIDPGSILAPVGLLPHVRGFVRDADAPRNWILEAFRVETFDAEEDGNTYGPS